MRLTRIPKPSRFASRISLAPRSRAVGVFAALVLAPLAFSGGLRKGLPEIRLHALIGTGFFGGQRQIMPSEQAKQKGGRNYAKP